MSYVEHGPRIFLASRHNSGTPLMYGDYVLPKKRLEGRLKLHDSCSDIRAWSPNSLENSRYFRELNEHDSSMGKIIPFNVIIDNIIQLNPKAQNELQIVKKELKKYKTLKLTTKQEEQLQNLDNISKIKELPQKNNYTTGVLKGAFFNISKSGPIIQSNLLSIHTPCKRNSQSNTRNVSAITNQYNQLYSYSLTMFDPSLKNYNLIPSCRSTVRSLPSADYNKKTSSWIEYIDVAVQVNTETHDMEIQIDDEVDKYLNKIITISAMSQTSFTSKFSNEDNSADLDKNSSQTNNHKEQSFECDASCSNSSQDIESLTESDTEMETESDFDLHNSVHKGIIIQKDSEIIVLKNELCVRDAELEELHDMNKHLEVLLKEKESCIYTQQGNLKMLHEKLYKLDHERNCEVEDLKKKLYSYKYLMEQLKQDLNEKCESCYLYSEEIEKLQLYVKETTTLQLEKELLLKKIQEMEQLVEKAEKYNITLDQLKNVLEERDELKKQNYEQNCILTNQEEKLNQLLKVIKELSIPYNEQMETKNMLEVLKTEIQDKDIKIAQHKEELVSMKQEISDFFNKLKYVLNNLEELNGVCEEICNCSKCSLDIGEEANNILYNINIIIARFQSYKIESQNLLQQIGDLKHYIENDKLETFFDQNLKYMICEKLSCDSEVDSKNTIEDNVVAFNVKQDMTNSSEIEFDDISNAVNNKNLLSEIANNLDSCGLQKEYYNYTIKLSRKDVIDNIEKEIIEYFTHFLIKLRSLTQKLQIYVEIERPVMIKQTYYLYEILKDTQSAINVSQDITLKKQLFSELYNQHKKENKKYDSCIKQLPNDLLHIQNKINEFIENILYQLLNEILHTEETYLYDEKINKAIEIHLKSCINKINTALQGAGDQHIQITGTIEEQQNELKRKNLEIAQLKEIVEQQRGEGIGLNEENIKIKEQLSKITTALNKKDDHVLKLEQQLEILKSELFIYDKDCNALKKENKNLENITNRLSKECRESKKQLIIKTKQIKNLSEQVRELLETKNLKTTLENKIKEIEKRLSDLQFENYELEKNIIQSNMIISTKEEAITTLKNKIDASNNILSQKISKYKNAMEQKHHEIIKLEDENILLNEKLKDVEHKLIEMNLIIVSLTEQNDKINIIYTMQEDLAKLDKYEKKLKVELSNLRTQLINDQNSNKKLDNSLDIYLHENEILEKNVEYWKNENSELLIRLHNEVMEENLKSKLYTLSNQIYERLLSLQNLSNLEKDSSNSKFIKKLHDQYIIHQDEIIELTVNNRIQNFKLEYKDQKREVKETEIEKIDVQLSNNVNIKEVPENNCITFERSNSPNNLLMRYKIEHMKSEHNENQNEIMNRDGEIKHPKEIIKHLVQENAELRAILKSQMEEYQDKIILMKKNYDSSLNAVCERHKANVEILQKQFEDDMKSEKMFDSENWLLSLNMKELMGLHEQITVIINNSSDVIHMENENKCLYDNAQQEFYATLNEVEKKFQILPTNVHEEGTTMVKKNLQN
ncbi:putative leucine-rich repeat-containing protein DDB_G0290503 isoform X3 [Bombus flavifrons]|uniref:putative leucine-rich repeat-containing protein DDB_G0290503 isoform X3 n=1 Tax=Bombus flavifrons TaxID=103934 RepID=UPI00370402F5